MSENSNLPSPVPPGQAPLGSGAMFDRIAERYDFLNRVLSLGIDHRWRRRAIAQLRISDAPAHIVDVATGTADIALAIHKRHPHAEVTGVDPSVGMLDVGKKKSRARGADAQVRLLVGDALSLPLDTASVDGAIIAFGIRNIPDRRAALAEMVRVVRPGGRVVVLELVEPEGRGLGRLARFHVHHVVPRLGGWLSGSREYRHLQQSIEAFPPPATFQTWMEEAGLVDVSATSQTFGVAYIFAGTVAGGTPDADGAP